MSIADNIKKITSELGENTRLVAVSKTKPNEDIMEAYNAGQRLFGENKVQELVGKYETLPKDIEWHFIGHLQTNKVKYIAPFVSLIHGVDSFKLLKTINKEAKKKDKIKFLGYLSYQEYMRVLEKCHILLAPSLTASDGDTEGGAPVVLLDAMASGMPVVSTLHADIPEVVVDGETGFLVPEKDVDALVEALEKMINAPSLWKKMGKKGRQRIEKEFNVNIQAERLERIYDRYA